MGDDVLIELMTEVRDGRRRSRNSRLFMGLLALVFAMWISFLFMPIKARAAGQQDTAATNFVTIMARYFVTPNTLTIDNTLDALQTDANHNLKVVVNAAGVGTDVNLKQVAGATTAVGHGISGTGVQRVELPTDGTGVVGLNAGTAAVGTASTTDFHQTTWTATGVKTSNGGTAVVIIAASAAKIFRACGTLQNKGVVQHTGQLISSGGTVLDNIVLSAGGGLRVYDESDRIFSLAGEGISFLFTDGTGTSTDLTFTGATAGQ